MSEFAFTTQQQRVLTLLAQGSTVAAAAEAVGVHRNTVANWRRAGSPAFRHAWQTAQWEQAQYWRDQMQTLGELAVKTLHQVMTDGAATPSVRLRAALAVLDKISKPASAEPPLPRKIAEREAAMEAAMGAASLGSEIMHNPAHSHADVEPEVEQNEGLDAGSAPCAPMHNPAQRCTRDEDPEDQDYDYDENEEPLSEAELASVLGPFEELNRAFEADMALKAASRENSTSSEQEL